MIDVHTYVRTAPNISPYTHLEIISRLCDTIICFVPDDLWMVHWVWYICVFVLSSCMYVPTSITHFCFDIEVE